MQEFVILVDEENNEIGTALKKTVHTTDTPLHRAFSLFLFNSKSDLLITKRAGSKKTFPGIWTNSVCGHQDVGETLADAALRRLKELGITGVSVKEVAPYRYRFADKNGIVENEICPIFVAFSDTTPRPDATEVDDWRWISWAEFFQEIQKTPTMYSPWCIEEAKILDSLQIIS